jgi:hypothetical protein
MLQSLLSTLSDEPAIIIRTMFEIESQLGAIKEQPELARRLIQHTEWDRLKRTRPRSKASSVFQKGDGGSDE